MTTIITKNSSTASSVPVAGDLTKGELAVNVTDKKLYTKDNGGSVVKLVGSLGNQEASAVAITGGTIDGTPIGGTTASTASFTTVSASGNVTLSGGTANGVLYLNGSKVATSGSALTFDGSVLNATSSIQINSANYVGAPSFGVRYNASNARIGFGIGNANGFPYIGYNTNNKNGSDTPTYDLAQAATQLRMDGGQFIFNYAGSGAAGADISWSEAMRVTSTGLGIGTSSPQTRLEANQTGVGSVVIPIVAANQDTSTTGTGAGIGFVVDGVNDVIGAQIAGIRTGAAYHQSALAMYTRDSVGSGLLERIRLDSSGNLGLGVTPSANSIAKAFELQSGFNMFGYASLGYINANAYYNGGWLYKNTAAAGRYEVGDAHKWFTAPSGTAGDAITFTQALTLDASGRLLIGATSGTRKLEVHTGNGTETAILLNQSGVGAATLSVPASTNALAFGVFEGGSGLITERARIDSSGNFMAGRTSALAGARISAETSSGSPTFASYAPTTGTEYAFDFVNPNGIVGSITTNGSATLYNTTSDQRLKENIADAPDFGSVIDSIKVRSYDWKADGNHQRAGFVAQELVTVAPEAVHQPADPEEMMAVDYSKLVPMLVKEIQSLRARVAQLESN